MARYAIFGDSHVSRLCNGGFGFGAGVTPVCFFGQGGLYAARINETLLRSMLDFNPTHVLIILGGNDLSVGYRTPDVVNSLLSLRDRLLSLGISRVFVGEIFERSQFRWTGINQSLFGQKVRGANRRLRERLGMDCFCLRGFQIRTGHVRRNPMFCSDGVHLSRRGMGHLCAQIRRAFARA